MPGYVGILGVAAPTGGADTAARFDGSTDKLSASATGTVTASGISMAGWIYIDTDRNNYSQGFGFDDAGSNWHQVITNSDGTSLGFSTNGSNRYEATTTGTWYFVGSVYNPSGTDYLYIGTKSAAVTQYALAGGATGISTSWTFSIGNNPFSEWINGRVAYVRVWSAVCTQAEIEAERLSTTLVKTTGIWGYWPLQSGSFSDTSGNSHTLTQTGTVTSTTGPGL